MSESEIKKGGISVDSEHIFPIIKKWLYSEKDIFLREIVSNASDAVTKLKRLESLGEVKDLEGDFRINVKIDKTAKTLTVEDNGIGMTEEELSRYICQIALSGALEFIQKYEDQSTSAQNGIIGHFGLGFYSSFMVSDTVEVVTKSYTGAKAVRWVCNGEGEYELGEGERNERGTSVIMHIAEGEEEYLNPAKIRSMLDKYCAFMPVKIYFDDGEAISSDDANEESPINDISPLWLRNPSDCKPEEYNDFYKKVFSDYRDPLFYIHINADYPLNFKGILFFPRINNEFESVEGQIKLYYNQVFVADNIKEIIPDYMFMLKGVVDCPELPLNVSRSYLQNNSYVSKVSAHIVKKVADKLNALCLNERQEYEKVWGDIRTFVEFACMKDKKFYDRVSSSLLLKLTDGSFVTTDKYLEDAESNHKNTVYYATDPALQAQYILMFSSQGIKIALFEKVIDTQFISMLESYNSDIKYVRVDADIADILKGEGEGETEKDAKLEEIFKEVSGNAELKVVFENLKDEAIPAILNVSEQSRRMEEMMKLYSMSGINETPSFPLEMTIILNTKSSLISHISALAANDFDKAKKAAKQVFYLSLISQRALSANELKEFLSDSYSILENL